MPPGPPNIHDVKLTDFNHGLARYEKTTLQLLKR